MNADHHKRWVRAALTGMPVLSGRNVACDCCDADFTDSTESGGFLMADIGRGGEGICPKCDSMIRGILTKAKRLDLIIKECPPDKSFADLCREARGAFSTVEAQLSPALKELIEPGLRKDLGKYD